MYKLTLDLGRIDGAVVEEAQGVVAVEDTLNV